jgi:WS/DGAT/MGAT family acyltransferase
MVTSKLPQVPRYRQTVRQVPFQLGRPLWVDDPHFQILYHIKRTAVPAPGGDDELRNLAGRVFAQRLDRDRPLWEIWMVEGLRGNRWALISKVHHAMVDGVSGTDLLTVLLDKSPAVEQPVIDPWDPPPGPSTLEVLADAALDRVLQPVEAVRGLPAFARSPLPGGMTLGDVGRTAATYWSMIRSRTADLNGPIGPHRRWSWAKSSLADIKLIRQVIPGTVNDVVLAVITRGFRDLLMGRGAEVEGRVVRTMVPVSTRSTEERGTYNNRVSAMFPELPVGIDDPVLRLEEIHRQMEGLKETKMAQGADSIMQMAGFAPPMLLAMGTRLAARMPQRTLNTVTTNVPGPQYPLYIAGRQMIEAYPFVPIQGQVRITIAIFSYFGQLNFGVTGDYDGAPDIDVLCHGIEEGMQEYLEIARRAGASAQRRAAASAGRQAVTASGRLARKRATPASHDGGGLLDVTTSASTEANGAAATNGNRPARRAAKPAKKPARRAPEPAGRPARGRR